MRRTRQVLAVVVVTTALCADRAAAAAPVLLGGASARSSAAAGGGLTLAGRLVNRLSQTFRQVVPSTVAVQARQVTPVVTVAPQALADQSLGVQLLPISPFQFRLPPPIA